MFSDKLLIISILISFTFAANLNNTSKVNNSVELKINNSTIKQEENKILSLKEQNKDNLKNVEKQNLKDPTDELANFLIGSITNKKQEEINKDGSSKPSNNTNNTMAMAFDELRVKVIEQVQEKAKIFFRAITGSSLLRESSTVIKNKNDIPSKPNSIYSSTPYLKPYQNGNKPMANNQNNWCTSLSTSFAQYTQLNAFLLAAFLLFPVTIPLYFFGFFILLLLRAGFCSIGVKQILSNVVYRIRSS